MLNPSQRCILYERVKEAKEKEMSEELIINFIEEYLYYMISDRLPDENLDPIEVALLKRFL